MLTSTTSLAATTLLAAELLSGFADAARSNPAVRRRHHARLAARQEQASNTHTSKRGLTSILTGLGQGTLYYDLNGGGTCGPANGWTHFAETNGYGMCEPNAGYKTLAQRGSNRVVAMPSNMLSGRQSEYCGKEVVVTFGGKTVDNLILWDGCAACNSNNGLDFSSTVFAEIFGEDNCNKGRIDGMSWEITSKQIWNLNGDPVDNSGSDDDTPAPSSSSSSEYIAPTTSSSSWTPESSPSSTEKEQGEEKPATSAAPWSSSSSWVASSSSSSLEVVESSQSKKGAFSSKTQWEAIVMPVKTSASSAPAPSSSSYEAAAAPEETQEVEQEAQPAETITPSADAPAPIETEESPVPAAPSSGDSSDGGVCNEAPGAWRCAGWTLQQCIQTVPDWTWSTRVSCAVAPINCDSPNPVCPQY